ncbi:response regulator transcription factor [Nitrincola schmidtii]|uniref:response regulator transcription factor n=1 Tax=Nitrincola schmidtii TaxID=1730894 RepID=UPI00124BD90A|nr:response regulator transcription factor [Nitrincola schmidtii]
MNIKNLFITDERFNSQRWTKAFPDAEVVVSASLPPSTPRGSIVWILTDTNNWLDMIAYYTQNNCTVVAMSRQQNIDELREALEAGARGYIDALSNVDTLKQVANSISENAMWLPATLVARMVSTLSSVIKQQESSNVDLNVLTDREREVTSLILKGASNKEVARQLDITERTVKAHLTSIFSKLGARDRMHLMLLIKGL